MKWLFILLFAALFLGGLEIFIPSGGILLILCVLALAGSILIAFQMGTVFGWVYFVTVVVFSCVFAKMFAVLWPRTAFGRRMSLNLEDNTALAKDDEKEHLKTLVGKQGIAKSLMMPSGAILVGGIRYDALSESEPIDAGSTIVVSNVQGTIINVRKCNESYTENIPDPFDGTNL